MVERPRKPERDAMNPATQIGDLGCPLTHEGLW